jgi:hypothetical protein
LEGGPGHRDKCRGEGRGHLDHEQCGRKSRPRAHATKQGHGPEEWEVEEGDVVVDVGNIAEEDHDGSEDENGEDGGVVEYTEEGARLLAVAYVVGRGGVAGEDVTLGDEACDEDAVGAEEQDGVEGDEERREDASDDGLPGDAHIGANGGEEEVESRDQGGGEGAATNVFLLEDAGEDDGERGNADARELVGWEGCIAVFVSL